MATDSRFSAKGNLTLEKPIMPGADVSRFEEDAIDILENAPLAVHLVDGSGTIIWANKAELELLGYSYDEFVGRDIHEFHADESKIAEILDLLHQGVELKDFEAPLKHKDGSIRIGSISSNVKMSDGRFEHTRCFTRDVTAKKRTEAEFQNYFAHAEARKRLYEALLSNTSDFSQAYGRDGRIVYVNQALLDLWGLTLDEVVGKNFFDLNYPTELAKRIEDQIAQVFATGSGLLDRTPYTSPLGKEGFYEYIFQPVFSDTGEVEMVVGSTRDISEHQRAISDLRETQELLGLAMLSSRMGAWSRNLVADSVEWTSELEAIFGLEPGTFGGTEAAFLDRVLAEDRDFVIKVISDAVASGKEYSMQFRFTHADGSVRWMEGRGQPFYNEEGEPVKIFGIGIDITDRKLAEAAHLENERSLEEMANAFPQLAWMADSDGYIFWYNQQWYDYTGTSLKQMEGWGWQSVHDPEILPEVLEKWKDSIVKGEAFEMEFPLRRSDGQFQWFLTRATPFRDANGNITRWFGTNTNIEELWNIRRKSEEANRAKDEFLAVLSHELRAPLNLMSGWVQILRDQDFDAETVRTGIDVIGRNIAAQEALIEDLLDVSRIVSGKVDLEFSELEFGSVVTAVIDALRTEAKSKEIELNCFIDVSIGKIRGDEIRLTQVVSNILNNALKFSSAGSSITIELSQPDDYVRLSVKDEGVGISEEVLPFIFDRFRQADSTSKRTYGGLGLGLAIVERLVTLHGGKVRANSEGEGLGTEIVVEFPMLRVSKENSSVDRLSNEAVAVDAGPRLSDMRVLVVDDDPDALELMHMFLKIEGADVVKAKSAKEALELLSAYSYDLLISDLGMPEMDGFELIRSIRTSTPPEHLPAIALTGFASEGDKTRLRSAGFQAHLPKPIEFADLMQRIADIYNQNERSGV
ncbi:MAG TPA: PAS domain S-box protein [Pyrinomonadaceae bacterium]